MSPRHILLSVALLPGCMTIHAVGGSAVPGEVYVAAQRSALGVPGEAFVVRCQDRDADAAGRALQCERILTGGDLRSLRPGHDETATFPASSLFAPARREIRAAPAEAPAGPSPERALLDRVYAALGVARPDPATMARDEAAVRGLARRGYGEPAILAGLAAARDAGDAPVHALAARMLEAGRDEIDFEGDE